MFGIKHQLLFLLILLFALIGISSSNPSNSLLNGNNKEISKYLIRVHDECYSKIDRNGCLEKYSREVLDKLGLSQILTGLKGVEDSNSSENFHDFLTFVGREQYKREKNLPKLFEDCTYVYAAACFHGAVAGFVSDLQVKSKDERQILLSKACDFAKGDGPKSKCVHGIGHGLMLLANGDVFESLKACDNQKFNLEDCYEGVFMENFPGTSTSDHPVKYVKKDEVFYPCNVLGQAYVPMCYRMLSYSHMAQILPNYTKLSQNNLKDINKYCQSFPPSYKNLCYASLGDRIARTYFKNTSQLVSNCTSPLIADPRSCISGLLFVMGGRAFAVSQLESLCKAIPIQYREDCDDVLKGKIKSAFLDYRESISSIFAKEGIDGSINLVNMAVERGEINMDQCYILLHLIGHEAWEKYQGRFNLLASHESNFCVSSFQHGIEGQIAQSSEDLSKTLSDLRKYCCALQKVLPGITCYHGVGHGSMRRYLDVKAALNICDEVVRQGPEKDPFSSCNEFSEKYKNSCYSQLAKILYSGDLDSSFRRCLLEKEAGVQSICVKIIGGISSRIALSKSSVLVLPTIVNGFSKELKEAYLEGVLDTYRGYKNNGIKKDWLGVCKKFKDFSDQQHCSQVFLDFVR